MGVTDEHGLIFECAEDFDRCRGNIRRLWPAIGNVAAGHRPTSGARPAGRCRVRLSQMGSGALDPGARCAPV